MKVIFITGNHTRHVYLVKKFSKFFKDFRWIVEKREININHDKKEIKKIFIFFSKEKKINRDLKWKILNIYLFSKYNKIHLDFKKIKIIR